MTRICSVLVLLGLISMCVAQKCKRINHLKEFCVTNGQVIIECPAEYRVDINNAEVNSAAQSPSSCSVPDSTALCGPSNITANMKRACLNQFTQCTYNVDMQDTCAPQGVYSILVDYRCVPMHQPGVLDSKMATAIALGKGPSNNVTRLVIDGKPAGLVLRLSPSIDEPEKYLLKESDASCRIRIPAETEVEINPYVMVQWKPPENTDPCEQKFVLWDVKTAEILGQYCYGHVHSPTILPCSEEPREFLTQYVTSNPEQGVVMHFIFRAADEVFMNGDCRETFVKPTTTTTTTLTSSSTDHTTEADGEFSHIVLEDSEGPNIKLIIILVSCAVALLLLIIAVLIVLIRYKRDSDRDEEHLDKGVGGKHFSHVTEVYVDEDQKAKLVRDPPKSTLPSRTKF